MITAKLSQLLFVSYGFIVQVLLIINFAARNWRPSIERRYGGVIYTLGIPAILMAALFLAGGQPWYMILAPILYGVWAGFGYAVDRYFQIAWRRPPRWSIFIPYVVLFMASQFSFWIPLFFIGRGYWTAYAVMYCVNTGLNIYSHRGTRKPSLA